MTGATPVVGQVGAQGESPMAPRRILRSRSVMDRNTIRQKVIGVLVDVMGMEEQTVNDNDTLAGDLSVESIDLLDVQFRLERAFNINFERNELFPDEIFTDRTAAMADGFVTPRGRKELMDAIPHLNWEKVRDPLPVGDLNNLFTVEALINFIESKLNAVNV